LSIIATSRDRVKAADSAPPATRPPRSTVRLARRTEEQSEPVPSARPFGVDGVERGREAQGKLGEFHEPDLDAQPHTEFLNRWHWEEVMDRSVAERTDNSQICLSRLAGVEHGAEWKAVVAFE
jgi:hypothetical protein